MKKKTLIIKARSRLGMKYIPHGGTELNIGVEEGPDAILNISFLKKITDYKIIDCNFSLPEQISDDQYYSTLAKEISTFAKNIEESFIENDRDFILTVGGDHSIASASLLASTRLMKGKKLGVIMFDSHGDIHLKHTSPTGNYHGMWLRPFWGIYDDIEIQKVIDIKLKGSQLIFIGNVLLEDEEAKFLKENQVKMFPSTSFSQITKNSSYKALFAFCSKYDAIHVSFDIDVFNTDLVSATGTPNPDGFNKKMIFDIIDILVQSQKVSSLDLVEVNPKKVGAEGTISLAQEVILSFLK